MINIEDLKAFIKVKIINHENEKNPQNAVETNRHYSSKVMAFKEVLDYIEQEEKRL